MSRPEPIPRIPAAVVLLIGLVASLFFTCRSSRAPATGAAEVTAHALTASAVAEVRLTVQSPSVLPISLRVLLVGEGDQFSAVINNLALASDYAFTAEAFDGSGKLIAHGEGVGVVISKGQTTTVIIYLNEISQPPAFADSSPIIDGITLSASSISPGGSVAITATAHDPDPGQTATLTFSWLPATACGTMSDVSTVPGTDATHPSQSKATWTAPQADGPCQITLTVKDVLGLADSASFVVTVTSNENGSGSANVLAVFNSPPVISGLTADPAQISTQGPTSGVVAVLATDPDNDTLSYSWTVPPASPCAVELASPAEASTNFTISGTAAGATACTFLVAVSDGFWPGTDFVRNVSTASLTLAVTSPLVLQLAPVFGIAYQSEGGADSGSLLTFAAIASDPAGGQLSFDWSASSGSAPVAADPVSLGLDPAFSTAATWAVPDGAQDAGSDLVVTVTATSSVSNLPSSFSFCVGATCGGAQPGGDVGGP
jgi:hypothetical protein